ncbi:protein IQ-DOMAIN 2-like [Rutidosis leptorrhynchoides]|uniref:protein IQ-DOMAIN 2-like n=1 Tax=Rutidosis leptorrhynchoides TaxID=125765 RepID=UPI003A9A3D57
MGKKGSWISSIKKALSPNSKKSQKSKKKGLEDERPPVTITEPVSRYSPPPPLPPPPPEVVKPIEVEDEVNDRDYPVAAEPAATTTQTGAESTQYSGKSMEEIASIRIQTAFRGHLARRALRALRGLVRLKTLVEGPGATRQTENTLKCMQNVSRVQSQINARRIRMSEENQTLQRQILQKQAKELESLQMVEEWNDSLQSKEQIEAKLLRKYEATMKRERAMAYSFSHQQPWKKSSRTTNLLFMDPANPQWGWSWLERYMGGQTRGEKDQTPVKNGINITGSEIAKSYSRRQLISTPATPKSVTGVPLTSRKFKRGPTRKTFGPRLDDDSRSVFSIQSEMHRRHSIAGSSVRDDESMDSSPSVPSYMAQTKSARAKSKGQSLLGLVENGHETSMDKRASFPGPPTRPRRHSGPPKIQSSVSMVI